ncbi:MAG: DNA translocase FtsK 4TM domain-containing protein [SAR324 cluster bacterium]|nr:DNA translocase FtsK 4TM domain-containing protein [SAR324 cluster bacterium]MBL7034930.1 DNA translocase FtsK 4TM domain-containing protein [SAR324 cluster bacterium]
MLKLRIDYLLIGGLGAALMLSMLTADFRDPTAFNQLLPVAGIQNWTGVLGALTGGTLLEIFGPSAALLPWFFVRIILHEPRRVSILTGAYYAFVIVFALSIFHQLSLKSGVLEAVDSELFWQDGYAGQLALYWIEQSLEPGLILAALTVMFIFSLVRMFHVLSPLPFILAIITGTENSFSTLLRKISPPPKDHFSTVNLPNFK